MSEREVRRVEVLNEVHSGRRTVAAAASVLGISERQTFRLLVRAYRDGGGGALIHKAHGRSSNNQVSAGVREYALELVSQSYRDFDPTLATEALFERHEIRVGRETVRKSMVADVLWVSRSQRRTLHSAETPA